MRDLIVRSLWFFAFRVVGRLMPMRLARVVSGPISRLIKPLTGRGSVARINLEFALPELDRPDREKIERDSFRTLVRTYLEIPIVARLSRARIADLLGIANLDLLTSADVDRRGALLLSGHLGNWEILALASSVACDRSFLVVVRNQRDYGYLDRMRRRTGNRTVLFDRAPRAVHRELADGGVVALLSDQSAGEGAIEAPFFGHSVPFFRGAARLAVRYRPVVIVGFAVASEKGGGYRTHLERIPIDDLSSDRLGEAEFMRRYASILERAIRENPDSWLWHHRRFKRVEGVRYET